MELHGVKFWKNILKISQVFAHNFEVDLFYLFASKFILFVEHGVLRLTSCVRSSQNSFFSLNTSFCGLVRLFLILWFSTELFTSSMFFFTFLFCGNWYTNAINSTLVRRSAIRRQAPSAATTTTVDRVCGMRLHTRTNKHKNSHTHANVLRSQ